MASSDMLIWSTWVKTPALKEKHILIASACLRFINNEILERLRKGRTVLLACPEGENPALYGKIASMIRSSRPKSIIIVTIDGSPHYFQLHAAVKRLSIS
jgi:hypothetical protein